MKVDWGAVVRAIVAGDASGRGDPSPVLASLADTDPAGAMALSAHLAVTGDLTGFMSTRAPEADPDPGEGPGGPPPERVGAWKLAERIGSGGMGQVWLVRRDDGVYDQIAAMKLVASPAAMVMDRFRDERQRLARLDHPNIARIIDGGEDTAGRPFMVVEFVEGAPIADWCAGRGCDPRTRVRLLVDLCDALAHAHARLVLHLDIKSANVLVNSDGQLRLIDFGIAALIPEAAMADTHRQGRALTLVTAAPEQLEGEAVSVATDIFQVGMLAHLLLVGRLPERQADGSVVIAAQALGNPDLAAIIARATAFDPANRYASVDALGEDFTRFLDGFVVSARPVAPLARLGKLIARNRLASAMGALAAAALVAGLVGVSVFALRASEEAEANRIAKLKGADSIELYETFNAGFNRFIASVDPNSSVGQQIFGSMHALEQSAEEVEASDPQKALEIYVFLAEVYGDAGQDEAASRIGRKLAALNSELSYASAFTLLSLLHLSSGYVEPSEVIALSDRLDGFFSSDPELRTFDRALNRCVRAKITRSKDDSRLCLDLADDHLQTIDRENYGEIAGNLTLIAYAADSALELRDFTKSKMLVGQALDFYDSEQRPASASEAVFWLQLSEIAQLEEDWQGSLKHLGAARTALGDEPGIEYLEVAIGLESAQTLIALEQFAEAEAAAGAAVRLGERLWGPDHFQLREINAQLAMAVAGQGEKRRAAQMLEDIIRSERSAENHPEAIAAYSAMLKKIAMN